MDMLTIGIVVAALSGDVAPGLVWQGKAVHPGCIKELSTELSDARPIVAAIDLEGCQQSNRHSGEVQVDGRILRVRDADSESRGYVQYEDLGSLMSEVHVVRIAESGGGSGVFQSLLFLRTASAPVVEDGKTRLRSTLTLVGSETLGDRAESTVSISGNDVTIRIREFRGALGMGPWRVVTRSFR
jgi:hypothetical protein